MPTPKQALSQFEAQLAAYTKQAKKGWEIPLTSEEMQQVENGLRESRYQNEAFSLARDGVYDQFEAVPLLLKNYLGTRRLNAFLEEFGADVRDPKVQQALREHAMDPVFRVGVSIARHQGTAQAQELEKCEQLMNQYVMEKTLAPVSPQAQQRVAQTLGDRAPEALRANQEKQLMMAKILFLGQLGRFDQRDKDGRVKPYDETLSEAFCHGGRTKIALPYGKGQTHMMETLVGEKPKQTMGMDNRKAGTHYVGRPKVNEQGQIVGSWQELKPPPWFLPMTLSSEHKGVNVAVGGLGELGPTGKPILHDGGNGHMYMRQIKGNQNHCGVLLVGFENSGPGKKGTLGKPHGLSGSKAAQSVFMADKGAPGASEDGRSVDLSGMDINRFCQVMNTFDAHYRKLIAQASTPDGAQRIEEFNRKLCGSYMDSNTLCQTLQSMGLSTEQAQQTVNASRRPPVQAYDLPSHKVTPVSEQRMVSWDTKLRQKLNDALNLDLSDPTHTQQRLAVMENCAGTWKMVPLFDPKLHATPQARYERFCSLNNQGREIYAYGLGEQMPRRLSFAPDRDTDVSVSEQHNAIPPARPQKPGFLKRQLNKLTFGWAFRKEMDRYQQQKDVYSKYQTIVDKRTQRQTETDGEIKAYRAAQQKQAQARQMQSARSALQRQTDTPQRQRSRSVCQPPSKSAKIL